MAGITHLNEFKKPALRGIVDETVESAVPTLADRFLPTQEIYSRTFTYDVIKKTPHIAAMIGYGAEAPVVDRDAVAKMHGEIAKMGLKYVVTEDELLSIHEARNNNEKANMVEQLVMKGIDLVEATQKRINVIKMEALTKGSFTYNNNGVNIEVDFGIPSEHKISKDWTVAGADPLGDLIVAVDQYVNENGQEPAVMWLSREVLNALQTNPIIVTEAGRPEGSTRASQAEVLDVLESFGLPEVVVIKERRANVQNVYTGEMETIEFMPQNRVVMLGEGLGEFLMGITVENDFQPGIALKAYDKNEPEESVIKTAAAGFPAIEVPSLILHLDVQINTGNTGKGAQG